MTQHPIANRLKRAHVVSSDRYSAACRRTPDKPGHFSRAKVFSSIICALISRNSLTRSGWSRSASRRNRHRLLIASSSRSCMSSHRGDSGKKIMPMPRTRAGTICSEKGRRQDASDWPVQWPLAGMSVYGLNVREEAVPPV